MLHFSETNTIFVMNNNADYREVQYFGSYFLRFYKRQPERVKAKIDWTFKLIERLKIVPERFLKHITGTNGLYEIRIEVSRKSIRVFCFFDKGNLIILTNAFVKKSKRTPKKEIVKALRIKDEYEKEIK